ncbi:Hint domain-containing protein [Rhodobacteraceae bacterium F11138]|nr:Hint domain-containing protein [Rhodobacteraceae bacterium F11138]
MFLNHGQDFAQFVPADTAAKPQALPMPERRDVSTFKAGTMLETPSGWKTVETLAVGDQVYTLDGGFAELTRIRKHRVTAGAARAIHVPAGSLNNCSDMMLTTGQHVALLEAECETLFQAPCVLAPASALCGFRGITSVSGYSDIETTELTFANEEIVYAQTGALIHVPSGVTKPFFRTLGYGETRALLALLNRGHCGLDPMGFAPAQAA